MSTTRESFTVFIPESFCFGLGTILLNVKCANLKVQEERKVAGDAKSVVGSGNSTFYKKRGLRK